MTDWLTEARFILRGWRRTPGFSITVVLTLVLGLALASAIFAFADGYLFRPLPFPGADRTYFVSDPNSTIGLLRASDTDALRKSAAAELGFVEWDSGHRVSGSEITIGDRAVKFYAQGVSPGFRKVVALPLILGRDFTDEDHRAGEPVPVWLSHRFWTKEFGGDRGVLGRTFRAGQKQIIIVGVLAATVSAFDLNNEPPDAIAPETPRPELLANPNYLSHPIVQLPPAMTREQGIALIASTLQGIAPATDGKPRAVRLRSLLEYQVAGGRPTARVLLAGAMLVLILAAITLVHLLLARGVGRAAEVATRAALGASRWRVIRLFLTESAMLGLAGIAGGLVLGGWLSRMIEARIPRFPTSGRNMALVPMLFDERVVIFAVLLGAIIAVVGGLWPAWRALRRPFSANTRSASGLSSMIPARLSRTILASEIAVATVVLLGTTFIGTGIWRYLNQPLGFDYDDRLSVSVQKSDGQPVTPADFETARRAVAGIAGVSAAGPNSLAGVTGIEVPGVAVDPKQLTASAATPGYFETRGLRLLRGRWFAGTEFAGNEPVAVVDQKAASVAWPDRDAIGQEIRVAGVLRRVVGVTEPVRVSLSRPLVGRIYIPSADAYKWASVIAWAPGVAPADLDARVRPVLASALPGTTVRIRPETFEGFFLREVGEAEFQGPIMLVFGVLAFVLAGFGVFGLISYLVEQRTREFGIRLALGAQPGNIWRNVIHQSVVPAIAGLVIGLAGAWALESVVRSAVFGWPSSATGAVSAVATALLVVAVGAATLPARRAMRIDPATTLRME
jgi:predicted permease